MPDRDPQDPDLLPLLYDELRERAGRCMDREREGHTLQPTALVHEVYLKLSASPGMVFTNRTHFLATAATAMRQVLVDHARARAAAKRGGGLERITLDENVAVTDDNIVDLLEIHGALERLAAVDSDAERVVHLRFFGGLTEREIGEEMGRSERWVRDQWTFAKAWLRRELDPERG